MFDISRRYYAAMVLPFKEDGKIDEPAFRALVRYFVQDRFARVGGVIANPEAGEIFYLSTEEKRRVVEITMEEAAGKVPVVAGVFDMTTDACVERALDAKKLGVDGLFLMPPAGSADLVTSWDASRYPEYWLDQIKAIDAAANLPLITHPVTTFSPRWGIGIPGEAARTICEQVPNIVGWKMTYNYEGLRQIWKVLRSLDHHVSIMAAGGQFFPEFLLHGVLDGTVSGSWNYGLEPMLDHIDAWRAGDPARALEIWTTGGLGDLHAYIYGDPSRLHLRYKIAAWLRGLLPSYRMRPPMPQAKPEEIQTLRRLLKTCGIELISDAAIAKAA